MASLVSFEIFRDGRLRLSDSSSNPQTIMTYYRRVVDPTIEDKTKNRCAHVYDIPFHVDICGVTYNIKQVAWRVENNVQGKTKMYILFSFGDCIYRVGVFETDTSKDEPVYGEFIRLKELTQKEFVNSHFYNAFDFDTIEFRYTKKGLFIPSLKKTLVGATEFSGVWKPKNESTFLFLMNKDRCVEEIRWDVIWRYKVFLYITCKDGSHHTFLISTDDHKILEHWHAYMNQEMTYDECMQYTPNMVKPKEGVFKKEEKLGSICITDTNELHLNNFTFSPKLISGSYTVTGLCDKDEIFIFGDKVIEKIDWMHHNLMMFVKIRFTDGSIMGTHFSGHSGIYNITPKDGITFANEDAYLKFQRPKFPDVFHPGQGGVKLVEHISFSKDGDLCINKHSFAPTTGTHGNIYGEIRMDGDITFNVNYQSVTKTIHRIIWKTWKESNINWPCANWISVQIRFTDKTRIQKDFPFLLGKDIPCKALSEFDPLEKFSRKPTTNKIDIFEKMANEVEELLDQTKFKALTDEQLSRIKQLIEIKTLMSNSKFI